MPRQFHLHIENFRGIEMVDHTLNDGLTCIIGCGYTGKTTYFGAKFGSKNLQNDNAALYNTASATT